MSGSVHSRHDDQILGCLAFQVGHLNEKDPENPVIGLTAYPRRLDVFGMLYFEWEYDLDDCHQAIRFDGEADIILLSLKVACLRLK